MIRPKSRFWSFIFSLIPGCGQMYLGFMKRGLSLLAIFMGISFAAALTDISEMTLILVIVWCYSFFDTLNLRSLDLEQLQAKRDEYIAFDGSLSSAFGGRLGSSRFAGIALVVFGAAVLWRSVADRLLDMLFGRNERLYELMWSVNNMLPRIALSVIVIVAGVKLIRHKKTEVVATDE